MLNPTRRLALLVVLLAAAILAAPSLAANLGRVRALQEVDVRASIQERAAAVWRRGAGFLGSFIVEKLQAGSAAAVFIPRSDDYDSSPRPR